MRRKKRRIRISEEEKIKQVVEERVTGVKLRWKETGEQQKQIETTNLLRWERRTKAKEERIAEKAEEETTTTTTGPEMLRKMPRQKEMQTGL